MRPQNAFTYKAIRFHRFCRHGYAAFASMHRVVTIGRLAGYIADRQLHKSGRTFLHAINLRQDHRGEDDTPPPDLWVASPLVGAAALPVLIFGTSCAADNDCAAPHSPYELFKGGVSCITRKQPPFLFCTIYNIFHLMKKKILCLLLGLTCAVGAYAQQHDTMKNANPWADSVTRVKTLNPVAISRQQRSTEMARLHVVQVLGADAIGQLPVSTLADLLEQLPGVDLRTRGGDGVQADLSMRGGTFDQVLVLLNGMNITDPHTGHHNMDIPIDMALVDRVEILQGTALDHFGLSAFCGAINIITGESATNSVRAGVSAGSYGTLATYGGIHHVAGPWALTGALSFNRSDGYMHNTDYQYGNLFLQALRRDSLTGNTWNIQLGGQLKDFGANAYYSLSYPDQFEATKTLLASIARQRFLGNVALEYALFGRLHADRFELFRQGTSEPAAWYTGPNRHLGDVTGGNLKATLPWRAGSTSAGVELRNEHILSNVLGEPLDTPVTLPVGSGEPFLYAKLRTNINAFVQHDIHARRLSASLALSANANSQYGAGYCFSAAANYRLSHSWQLFANVGNSLRPPTFTDLYYHSATQISNPDLKPETCITPEIRLHFDHGRWHAQASAYYRHGRNVIDWIKRPDETRWQSANHTEVNAYGGEFNAVYRTPNRLRRLEACYAYCMIDKDAGDYLSKYALDYLHHKATLSASLQLIPRLTLDATAGWQQRFGTFITIEGETADYTPVTLVSARLNYAFSYCTLYVEGSNLLNQNYYDYGGIMQPGIRFMAGIQIATR